MRVTQSDNLFQGNSISGEDSSGRGGGEYIDGLATVSTNDTFVGNEITTQNSGDGGGLAYEGFGSAPFTARNLVAAGNIVDPAPAEEAAPLRGAPIPESVGGGLWLAGRDSLFRIEDSTIEGNLAAVGSGIGGRFQQAGLRGEFQGDRLALENSIVFHNEGAADVAGIPFDGEIAGFFDREVQSSDVCVDGAAHDGTGNICANPGARRSGGRRQRRPDGGRARRATPATPRSSTGTSTRTTPAMRECRPSWSTWAPTSTSRLR